jgi:hypothetical protein
MTSDIRRERSKWRRGVAADNSLPATSIVEETFKWRQGVAAARGEAPSAIVQEEAKWRLFEAVNDCTFLRSTSQVVQPAQGPNYTGITVPVPSGTAGDLLVAVVTLFNNSGTGEDIIAPAGWTQHVFSRFRRPGSPAVCVFYRVAASEPANYTFSFSDFSLSNRRNVGVILRYANAASAPLESNHTDYDVFESLYGTLDQPAPTKNVWTTGAARINGQGHMLQLIAVNDLVTPKVPVRASSSEITEYNAEGSLWLGTTDTCGIGDSGESFTNLLQDATFAEFDGSVNWTEVGGSYGPSPTASPNATAFVFLETGASGRHGIEQDISVVAGETYYIELVVEHRANTVLPDDEELRAGLLSWTESAVERGNYYTANLTQQGVSNTLEVGTVVGAGFATFDVQGTTGLGTRVLATIVASQTGTATVAWYGATVTGGGVYAADRAAVVTGTGNRSENGVAFDSFCVTTDGFVDPTDFFEDDKQQGVVPSDNWIMPRYLVSSTAATWPVQSTSLNIPIPFPADATEPSPIVPRLVKNKGARFDDWATNRKRVEFPGRITYPQQASASPAVRVRTAKRSGKWVYGFRVVNGLAAGVGSDKRGIVMGLFHRDAADPEGISSQESDRAEGFWGVTFSGFIHRSSVQIAGDPLPYGDFVNGDEIMFLWDADNGTLEAFQSGGGGAFLQITFSPDNNLIGGGAYVIGEPYVPAMFGPRIDDNRFAWRLTASEITGTGYTIPAGFSAYDS